jgi:hypothetical protein
MWYTVRLLSKAVVNDTLKRSLFEESLVVIEADSYDQAVKKAKEYGKRSELAYRSNNGHDVRWKFSSVVEVNEIIGGWIGDGTEVYSRLFRSSKPNPLKAVPKGPLDR